MRPALALTLLLPAVAAADPAAALRCLQRHYVGEARAEAGGPVLVLPDGRRLPWDDGRRKSFDEKLAEPDLEDLFSIPYRPGPIVPATTVDDDPGRIRVDALFTATYGESQAKVAVVPITFLGHRLKVHRRVAPAFARVEGRLVELLRREPGLRPFFDGLGGTFVWRPIAGTSRPSAHSYGVSIDLNVKRSHYWRWQRPPEPLRWQNRIPQSIVDAFEAEGFIWGGRWYHYDTMHFEYRPELLDPGCRP